MSVVFLFRDKDENFSFLYENFSWMGTNPLIPQLFQQEARSSLGITSSHLHSLGTKWKRLRKQNPELLLLIFERQMHSSAVSPLMCSAVLLLQIEVKCTMDSRQSIIYFQEKTQHLTDHNPRNERHFFSTLQKNKYCKSGFFLSSLPMCNVLK